MHGYFMLNQIIHTMKKALLFIGIFLWSFCGLAQVIENSPISNLEAAVYDNDTVLLTWDFPEDCEVNSLGFSWIKVDTIEYNTQYGYDSYGGSLFDEFDLRSFVGWRIESISFYKVSNWTHYICVFVQKKGESIDLLYSQEVSDDAPFGLNVIMLDEDIEIEADTRYWLALRIRREEYQTGYQYPFGIVFGDQGVVGKSDLWFESFDQGWWSMPYHNCWIKGELVNEDDKNSRQNAKDTCSPTGYRIYRNGELVKEIPYNFVTYFKDTEYTRGFDVEYCVTALYGDEESEPVCVTAAITGANEIESSEKFTISPNPTSGIVHIEGEAIAEIKVYNTLGQLVKTVKNTNEVDLKGLPKGIYTLRIACENGLELFKKVVLK